MILFEYISQTLERDITNIIWACSYLHIDAVIIPANPISKSYPDSIVCASLLQLSIKQKLAATQQCAITKELLFIPTIKTNNHTLESLQSAFLSLQYAHLFAVAIVSGDNHVDSSGLTTYDALLLLTEMSKRDSYFSTLRVFCAIESNLSRRTLESLQMKISFGVRDFITQPFYMITTDEQNRQNMKTNKHVQALHYEYFLKKIQNYIAMFLHEDYHKIHFFCGFLPLFRERTAKILHDKSLGIIIPKSYLEAIALNALEANTAIFHALRYYHYSISYLHFKDIQIFIESINTR
ncbi:hypothetical protein CQA66_06060 [Helicobacter aurati]|uniref:Uncharacterized protein n=1 Tax=Helicobacter aurati TaxID=137778 RepID=A0A3D8J2C5_9HELI|nr:hypothetical protein [Helicobacter aurati]RDU71658.1 hypothetical protein CQA66_06060 [Helicobacter aurati]